MPMKWNSMYHKYTEYTYQLSSWNLKKHMDSKTTVNRDQESHYRSVCTNFEEFILIHDTMNAKQCYSYVPLKLPWQGTK